MIKVVHFIETLYQGGAETLVKDYALLLDKTKFKIIPIALIVVIKQILPFLIGTI